MPFSSGPFRPPFALAAASLLLIAAGPAGDLASIAQDLERDPGRVMLTLQNQPITQADVADIVRTMPENLGRQDPKEVTGHALEAAVVQKSMALNARKDGLDRDAAVMRREAVAIDRVLADAWLNRQADAAVTESALRAVFDRDVAGRPGPEEVRGRLILVRTDAEARALLLRVSEGVDFGELAKGNSQHASAPRGGDLGYLPIEKLAPEIGPALFALPLGQVSAMPIATPVGFVLLRAEGRRFRPPLDFAEARPILEKTVRAEAIQVALKNIMSHVRMAPPDGGGTRP